MMEGWDAQRRALAEAQIWCAQHLDQPASSLRSEFLKPEKYPQDWMYGVLHPESVSEVIQRREQLLDVEAEAPFNGRILCVFSDSDLAMGEGTPDSGGIIDDCYFPPWDCWFALLTLDPEIEFSVPFLLLAWIPGELVQAVQMAVEVSTTQTLMW